MDKSESRMKYSSLEWCDHLQVEPFYIPGYAVGHIKATGCVFVIGQGKVRVVCETCTPDYLAQVQRISHDTLLHDSTSQPTQ